MRRALVALLLFSLGCDRLRRGKHDDAGVPREAAAVATPEPEPAPTTAMLEAKDVPQGHWETTDGGPDERLAVSVLPAGLVRFATAVPHYRNGARVFGQITHVEGDDADSFRVWVDVTRILAKEIGARHRWSEDFELFEAAILGERVTSPNANGHHVPELGGQGPAPPPSFKLAFDKAREHVELCTVGAHAHCRKLTKKPSPSALSRVRTKAECKTDDDCVLVTDGEQCDPCLCPTKPSVKSWPKKADPDKEDTSWETKAEHLCGKPIERAATCPACPALPKPACKQKQCVLKVASTPAVF